MYDFKQVVFQNIDEELNSVKKEDKRFLGKII